MRRNVGTEKDTAYGGSGRRPAGLEAILPPGEERVDVREPEEVPPERAGDGASPEEAIAVTVDGVEVRVPKGSTIFQAAEEAGYTPPHFCYHRDLSIPANCRMCLCEIENQGKLQTSCSIAAADGMVVRFDTDRVREAVQGVLEFEFKNHPLDCPVCDQVGECYLQKYYLEVGKYDPEPIDRVRKDKVKDLGPITLDAERCILCSRCVRFGDEIAGTSDFVIANRSDHAEIMTFEDRPIASAYALNYTDICPVGALTSNDFRFRKRVYWLSGAKSVCPECSTGCNIWAEQSEDSLYRYRPRYNDDVNDSWMCDPGRLSHAAMADTSDRIAVPLVRGEDGLREATWDEAVEAAAAILAEAGPVVALASARDANEDLWELRRLVEAAGGGPIDFRLDDEWTRVDDLVDGILIRDDPNPNTRGALAVLGLESSGASGAEEILEAARAGEVDALVVSAGDRPGPELDEVAARVVFVGARRGPGIERADVVLPASIPVEREGTFTNHAHRIQRFWPAISPYEESRPAWRALAAVRAALGGGEPPRDAAASFAELARAVEPFAGRSYATLGDRGAWMKGREPDEAPPVGAAPRHGVRSQQSVGSP